MAYVDNLAFVGYNKKRKRTDGGVCGVKAPESRRLVASVQKALKILDCFDSDHAELSLLQLCAMTGYPKTTVFGLSYTLLNEGYLEKGKGGFRLGMKMMELGYHLSQAQPITGIAAPVLDELCRQTGLNIYLTTHRGGRLLFLESCCAHRVQGSYSAAGKVLSMHCTASGKAIMSQMVSAEVNKILEARGLPAKTPGTITDEDALYQALAEIRLQGYALDREEETAGICCVAVPILNRQGLPVGALSASGFREDFDAVDLTRVVALLEEQRSFFSRHADLFPCSFLA